MLSPMFVFYIWSNHNGPRTNVSLIIIIVIVITIVIIIISGASARASRNWKPIDARKFGYDVAPARTPTTCKSMSIVTFDLAQIDTSLSVI